MAKLIHTMIRVRNLEQSVDFYKAAFNLTPSHRLDFPDFSLVYLRNEESDFELELTYNKGREDEYSHGSGYGHIAVADDDLQGIHQRLAELDLRPTDIKEFKQGEQLLARFFFVKDPDGYKIEVLERSGHYV